MASNVTEEDSVAIPRHRFLRGGRLLLAAGLLALVVLFSIFGWVTGDTTASFFSITGRQRGHSHGERSPLVDLHPWQTAHALAPLAVTLEEVEYAREAERLADHEVDQAFAAALRQAGTQHPAVTGKAVKLSQRLQQLQQLVKEDQARVQSLTQSVSHAGSSAAAGGSILLANDLEVAKAQLGLDSDELTDAQQELARAVDDPRTRIQQELAAHEAAMREYDAATGKQSLASVNSIRRSRSLANLLQAWFDQRTRYQLIQQAMQQAQEDTAALTARHSTLEGEANGAAAAGEKKLSEAGPDNTARVASLKNRAAQQQLLSIYDDRIQTEQQLASDYEKWSGQVLLQHGIVMHLMLQAFTLVAAILLCVVLVDAVVRHMVERPGLDRRRMQTLRTIFKLGIQIAGALLILLVIFGAPGQMPTIIGLTTAGMTVVLQDFILAFLGWFVLMGKNGIRVGDWVEINGIGGEVIETGLFRTVMLETGNWTDKGHPTGRRVTLMNGFAVKGQYFNFSTAGQWMWDEITFTIPQTDDSYRIIELIRETVRRETEGDAKLAEQEWKRVTRERSLTQVAASSAVDMRPGPNGIDLTARYVTRASGRFEVRNRLYRRVIDLLHQPVEPREMREQTTGLLMPGQ